jgi:signal transduction histidine kinase
MTGIAPGHHIGRTVSETLPTLIGQVEPLFHRVLEIGEPILGIELRGETSAQPGAQRIFIDNWLPLKDASGRVVAVNISVEEVTDVRRMQEEQHRQSHLRALAAALQEAREADRTSIARELHDELGQILTCIKLLVTQLVNGFPQPAPDALSDLKSLHSLVDKGIEAVGRISHGLRPALLDVVGVSAAIREHAGFFQQSTGIECEVVASDREPAVPKATATALFRIVQETLTNVARHSGATKVEITLRDEADSLTVVVRDNGRGMPDAQVGARGGLGILGMRERMEILGGKLSIHSVAGDGTYLTASVPHVKP